MKKTYVVAALLAFALAIAPVTSALAGGRHHGGYYGGGGYHGGGPIEGWGNLVPGPGAMQLSWLATHEAVGYWWYRFRKHV